MKDLEISKELLSEVLKLNITYIERCNNSIVYKVSVYDREEEVNIYEFVFKCKELAMSKGYQIISGPSDEPAYRKQNEKAYAHIRYYTEDEKGNGEYEDTYIMANTEVEAVIKASEYVLKEINENR